MKKFLAMAAAAAMMFGTAAELPITLGQSIAVQAADYTEGTYELLTYENYGDYIVITGCDESATEVTIPSEIDGVPVTEIAWSAFGNCDSLSTILGGENITCLQEPDYNTIMNTPWYTNLPEGVTYIGTVACRYVWPEETADRIEEESTDIIDSIEVDIEEGTTQILGDFMEHWILEDGGQSYQDDSGKSVTVNVPASVTEIGDNALSNTSNIVVAEANTVYSSQDGVLFNKDKTNLIKYPELKQDEEYIIPDTVTELSSSAFGGYFSMLEYLHRVVIPEGVTVIPYNCFHGRYNLTEVVIPDSVTTIEIQAFHGCSSLAEIQLPSQLSVIDDRAFPYCESLVTIDIPASVTSIGEGAFAGCDALTAINIEEGNSLYESKDGVLFDREQSMLLLYPAGKTDETYTIPAGTAIIGESAFERCQASAIIIPDTVTTLRDSAFVNCDNLLDVQLSDGLIEIGAYSFQSCDLLTAIEIPATVTSIDSNPFYECTSLEKISVAAANTAFCSVDGILCSIDKTVLISYPDGKTEEITIPDTIVEIQDWAMPVFREDSYISIPLSVRTIGANFDIWYWENLTDVYYPGTEEEWAAIEFGEWGNDALLNATIHYGSTAPESTEPAPTATPGDTNGDNDVTILDVIALNKNLLAGGELSEQGKLNADVDGDGTPTTVDSLLILKYVIKLIDSFTTA